MTTETTSVPTSEATPDERLDLVLGDLETAVPQGTRPDVTSCKSWYCE